MLKEAVVLITVLAMAMAYQAIAMKETIPDKFKGEAGCYMSIVDQMVPVGESVSPLPNTINGACQQYTCRTDTVLISGCGAVAANPPCTIQETKEKAYPDCCPTIVCP